MIYDLNILEEKNVLWDQNRTTQNYTGIGAEFLNDQVEIYVFTKIR